jgi:hypothetical protein
MEVVGGFYVTVFYVTVFYTQVNPILSLSDMGKRKICPIGESNHNSSVIQHET